jgi:hypothetical protein
MWEDSFSITSKLWHFAVPYMAEMQGFLAQIRHKRQDVKVQVANVLACRSVTASS